MIKTFYKASEKLNDKGLDFLGCFRNFREIDGAARELMKNTGREKIQVLIPMWQFSGYIEGINEKYIVRNVLLNGGAQKGTPQLVCADVEIAIEGEAIPAVEQIRGLPKAS